jgi:threonine dehydrogenase-like Zn-dependent dehydrogenase
MGSHKIVLVARSPNRLQIAEQLGFADVVLSSQFHDFAEQVKAETGGFGADLTIDCAGTEESAKFAIDCTIPGGRVVLFGVYPGPLPQFDANLIVLRDLVVYGALSDRRGWEDVITLVSTGKLRLRPLITHRFPLSQAPDAYALVAAKAPGVMKAVLEID